MMLEFKKPIPVIVDKDKEGYALYVTDSGILENDIWCIVLWFISNIIKHLNDNR